MRPTQCPHPTPINHNENKLFPATTKKIAGFCKHAEYSRLNISSIDDQIL